MKRILYASGSVLTGDDIAHSLVNYAAVLARAGSADTVLIPAVTDHESRTVEMLLGPASQLIVEDAVTLPSDPVLEQEQFVADIDVRTAHIEHPANIEPAEGLIDYDAY